MATSFDDSTKLRLEQNQTQRLLPLQVRVGRLLEMNSIEVEEEVKRALEELPALEVAGDGDSQNHDNTHDESNDFSESAEQMQMADYSSEDDMPVMKTPHRASGSTFEPGDVQVADSEHSLIESLSQQLGEQDISNLDLLIARYIIGNIDNNGYMSRDINSITDDIAIQTGHEVSPSTVRRVWQMVRKLDPAGIAATDLRDCLLLQLDRKAASQEVTDAREIIADYFDLFSKKHFDKISSATGIAGNRLRDALAVIRKLNPKPGGGFNGNGLEENSHIIVPDFYVESDGEHLTLTLLNNIPELVIEKTFSEDSARTDTADVSPRRKKEVQTFLKQHREEARDFIKTLKMRQETLFRVMWAIVEIQRDFFLTEDLEKIKPMILKDIAARTGLDISVISRAAASKYVATAHSVYPLKMFFNERTQADEEASQHQIMATIRSIISNEDKQHPLSDEQITELLAKNGFTLARRTVAKYRERLGFSVARLRKDLKIS